MYAINQGGGRWTGFAYLLVAAPAGCLCVPGCLACCWLQVYDALNSLEGTALPTCTGWWRRVGGVVLHFCAGRLPGCWAAGLLGCFLS